MGAWLSYGLGCEADDLPAFVAMTSSDKEKTCGQLFYDYYWGSGFLPSRYQGVRFRNAGDPVPYLHNPPGMSREQRRALLDDIQAINAAHLTEYGDPEIDTRISQYEMAFKMQASVPHLLDFSNEPKHVLDMYGPDALTKGTYANNCLIARRLIEGWRPLRPVDALRVGSAWKPLHAARRAMPRYRPAFRCARRGPQAARLAGRDACYVGRRVWAHAIRPGRPGKADGA
jgi:hypothetical protein